MSENEKAIRDLAYTMANAKLGEGDTVRCEGPTEYEIDQAKPWARRALRALARPDGEAIAGTDGVREAVKSIDEAVAAYNAVGSRETIHRLVVSVVANYPAIRASLANDAPPIAAAAQGEAGGVREDCEHCDGTGDVHGIDGEWRGRCVCLAATAKKEAEDLAERAGIDMMDDHHLFVEDMAQTLLRFASLASDATPPATGASHDE